MSPGRLTGIALRPSWRADMVERKTATIEETTGLAGDHAGAVPDRLVTILSREAWAATCADLDPPADPDKDLPWLTRRANLLVEGVRLPRAAGALLRVGAVALEVTHQTYPCKRMEEARRGLVKALAKDWRGGILCKVRRAGDIAIGDVVEILHAPPAEEGTRF